MLNCVIIKDILRFTTISKRITQLAGNCLHVGIGSDLDGAFGREQCPYDLETIADLQKLDHLLALRGYSATDIENILHGNWIRFLRNTWK